VRELVPLDRRKVMHPVAVAALRLGREALGAADAVRTRRHGGPADAWRDGAAAEMLALVRSQLEAPESVPPFRAFRYALEGVLGDDALARPVSLLDVGCGVGHYSELVDRWFADEVAYVGSDSSSEMVDLARAAFPGRRFVLDDATATGLDYDRYDVLLAGALIDVLVEWRPVLDRLLGSRARYVILHRQRLTGGRTRTRRARGYAGAWTSRTVLARRDLEALVAFHGREVALRLPVETGIETLVLRRAAL
jgi:SAM-dependent methyltransferase